ncbi:hypothetical protein GTZ99_12545 [Novosphingobium sp. FSY-8]|uniref:SGNH hydrolase-type esterase domain-containing protein n=1 Tax=Novosphingobium ovatum TaxID=1908523 RepID=A0ABW9XFQ0_9SPHN|nr:hypothetical protein [Novosphingobium ovatum]NBC37380.1 hypothetical protein [Novosphingobium ovatum]
MTMDFDARDEAEAARALALNAQGVGAYRDQFGQIAAAFRQSQSGNVYTRPPLIAPPAWTTSMTVARGDMVAANGYWYAAIQAGTTASSGSGPSFVTNYASDGTVLWSYVGPAQISTNDATAPTVAQTTSDPAYGNYSWKYKDIPSAFSLFGAYAAYDGANRLIPTGFNAKAATPSYTPGRRIEFHCDSSRVVIDAAGSTSTSSWRIAVDQYDGQGLRFIKPGGFPLASPYISLTWPAMKRRRYVIFLSAQGYDAFNRVEIDAQAQVWTEPGKVMRGVVISDSTVAGSGWGPWLAGNDVCNRLAMTLGVQDMWSFSTGGTGELNPGGSSYYKYGERIAEALALNPALWFIAGSVNDRTGNGYTSAQLTAATTATMQAIRAGGNTGVILRGGVFPLIDNSDLTTAETAIKAGYDVFAATDQYPHGWVPASSAVPPIITWGYNSASGIWGSNNGRYLGGDGHPIDRGTAHLSDRYAAGIMTALSPYLP